MQTGTSRFPASGVLRAGRASLLHLLALLGTAVLLPVSVSGFSAGHGWASLAAAGGFACLLMNVMGIFRHARQSHARELHASEQRHRADLLVRATMAGLLDWNALTGAVVYSERYKELLGYPADFDTSVWTNWFDMIHEEDLAAVRAVLREQLTDHSQANTMRHHAPVDLRLKHASGKALWVHAESMSITGANGRTLRYVVSFTDIAERRASEQVLRDQAGLIEAILERVPNAIFVKDAQGRFTLANRSWSEMSGYPAEKVIGKTVREVYSHEMAEPIVREDEALLAGGAGATPIESLHSGPRPDQWRIVRKAVFARADGTVQGLIATSTDVSQLKKIEAEHAHQVKLTQELLAALTTEQRRLDLVVRAAKAGIVDWDGLTRTAYYSPRLREIRGFPPDAETAGWPDYFEQIHPEDTARVRAAFATHIKGTGPEGAEEFHAPIEYRLLRADGSAVWVQGMGVSVRDARGYATRFIASISDVSERRAQDQALRDSVRLREEVERMSRHDLKTPINSVIAVSRLLRQNQRIAAEDSELLETVERASYRILNMVNLSLDLFRMEQGVYEFHPRVIDLALVASRVVADLLAQAESKDVRIEVSGARPLLASADELLCYSMFGNLAKNAIEAAPVGSTVTLTLLRNGADALVQIHNLGEVPEEVRQRFFQKYVTSGKSAGLGLGAYSAHLMARVQQGELTLATSAATGTTLSARFVAAEAGERIGGMGRSDGIETEPAPAPQAGSARDSIRRLLELPPLRVLAADDDEFNRLVLRRDLPSPPLTVTMVVNGRAAVAAAEQDWPDVVLLDLEMPVMDGYQAARRLRDIESTQGNKRCTIIAISSNDEETIIARAKAAGCDHYLIKPAPREVLWRLMAGAALPVPSAPPIPAAPATSMASADGAVVVDADLRDSLPGFIASRKQALDDMQAALTANDRAQFKRLAHRLAGSFALYGFNWASAQCKTLENSAETGELDLLAGSTGVVRVHLDRVAVRFAPVPPLN